jgi:hypothetical protein
MHIFFICVNLYTIKSLAFSSHELASHGGVDERMFVLVHGGVKSSAFFACRPGAVPR